MKKAKKVSDTVNAEKAVVKRIMEKTPPVHLHAYAGDFYTVPDVRSMLRVAFQAGRNQGVEWSTQQIHKVLNGGKK